MLRRHHLAGRKLGPRPASGRRPGRRLAGRVLACWPVLTALLACSQVTFSSTRLETIQLELNRRYALWKAQRIPSYDYTFKRFCLCPDDLQRLAVVSVRDSVLVGAVYADDGRAVPDSSLRSYFTVEGLFQQVQLAITLQVDSLVVEFDSQRHYPTKIVIDQDRLVPNDELALFASDLKLR